MNLMMENKIRYMIKVVTILSLCIGFANATGSGIPHESLVSANVNTTLLPTIQNELAELNVPESVIDAAIEAQKEKLAKNPLIINDSVNATRELQGFFVNNDITSPAPNSVQEGFIQHGSEGITRVFSSEGKQLFFVVDSETEKFQSPSGVEKPVSYLIAVPSGTIIVIKNNITYATYTGKILLTIFHDNLSSASNSGSDSPDQKGQSWVEYAESNTPSSFGSFSSLWNIPHSPQLSGETNILFNGIESSDPVRNYLLQPVTAYNFRNNCRNGWNPPPRPIETDCVYQNVWTGSAWIVFDTNNTDWHTYPPVNFSENDPAWGAVWWSGDRYWVQIKNERTDGTANIGLPGFSLNPSYQQAVVAYEAWPHSPFTFYDNLKIQSTTFTQMWAKDMGNNPIALNWINTINFAGHPLITGLHVNLSQVPSTVILETDSKGSKIGVFRSGQWILDYGRDGIVDRRFNYGLPTDIPVVGDFNNNGQTDIGVFRSGEWILDYGMDGTVDRRFNYGLPTDTPLVGDFNNDGQTDIGVFRSGEWILDYGMDGTVNRRFNYGLATDIPVVGDFNNNRQTDIGVFRSGQWILDYGMDGTVDRRLNYGRATDIPVVGDFNNDGTMDIGVYRSGQWLMDYGIDGTTNRQFYYGLLTDIPVTGKWI